MRDRFGNVLVSVPEVLAASMGPNLSERSGFLIRLIGIGPCGGDEVVKDLHHRGWGLDVRDVPDSGEHFKPTVR